MALLSGKTGKWTFFQSVHFRIFISVLTVFGVFCVILTQILLSGWNHKQIRERSAEALRCANLTAGTVSESLSEGTDLLDFFDQKLMYLDSGIRILILDTKGKVLADTSGSCVGVTITDEEVLQALGGTAGSSVKDDNTFCAAVPVYDSSETLNGVVYVLSDLEVLSALRRKVSGELAAASFALWILSAVILYAVIYFETDPLRKILRWLEHFDQPVVRKFEHPKRKIQDEYTQLVNAVDKATGELMILDQSRNEFVSNVSHELKTPLSSIKVLTESLLLQQGVSEDIYREFLQDINSEVDRMTVIINDLLTLVRLDEGEKVLNLSTFALRDMVDVILKRVEPLTREHHIHLESEYKEEIEIEADETKLTLAVSNLVQNAIKYNRDDGMVKVICSRENGQIVLRVSDTGIGIEREHFDMLFERFYRVDKARDRERGGSGLGLSIVRKIVALHGGSIYVESTPGTGSVFTITLPADQSGEMEEEG